MDQKRFRLIAMAILLVLSVSIAHAQSGTDAQTQVRIAKTANDSLDAQFQEVSTFMSFVFGAASVAVVGLGIFAVVVISGRYVRSQSTSDANQLIMNDPWVREHMAQQNSGTAAGSPPHTAPEESNGTA
jgi:hypothetical protein